MVQAPPVLVPPECRVEPTAREAVVVPTLPPDSSPEVMVQNARVAVLYWRERAANAEAADDVNAAALRVCSTWAKAQTP